MIYKNFNFQNIFLIGFKSSGKSTFGKKLSKILDFKLIDIDLEILKVGSYSSIFDLFQKEGKNYFQKKEIELFKKLLNLNLDRTVFSLGGGTIFNPYFDQNLKQYGVIFLIDPPFKTIKNRIDGQKTIYKSYKNLEEIYNKRIKYMRDIADFKFTDFSDFLDKTG